MHPGEPPGALQVSRLKGDSVQCEMTGCLRPAQALVKYRPEGATAVCELHLEELTDGKVVLDDSD